MGLFNRSTPADKATRLQEKLGAKLAKRGVSTEGLVMGVESFDEQTVFILLYEDRLDVVTMPKIGSMLSSGQGVESYPLDSISSTSVRNEGIKSYLKVTGSGFEAEVFGRQDVMPAIRQAIMDQKRIAA